jgi:DNA-directed RNA polymerase specialized sigma24 family protein
MLDTVQFVGERAASYATASDFCEAFNREMSSLYLLALLLTGNDDKAERCFISALDECVEETGVAMTWTSILTRRAIIEHAIQMIRPAPENDDNFSLISPAAQNSPFAAIRALGAFERFVFVMSVLEGWSVQDCALRLRCSRRDVVIARLLALKSVGSADAAHTAQTEATITA